MKKYTFELICRGCGETMRREMAQFDDIPNCPKCGSVLNAENVTIEEKTMATSKFEPKIIRRVTVPKLKLINGVPVYVKILEATPKAKTHLLGGGDKDKDKKKPPAVFNVKNLETGESVLFLAGRVVVKEITDHYEKDSYVGKCFQVAKTKTKADGGRGYTSYDIAEIQDPG